MTLCRYPANQIPILATAMDIHYFSSSCQKKKATTKLHERFYTVTNL